MLKTLGHCSPYQAVTGTIYRLKATVLTAHNLLKVYLNYMSCFKKYWLGISNPSFNITKINKGCAIPLEKEKKYENVIKVIKCL